MRYFAELAYKGTAYFGWQRQPDQISVQQELEDSFSTILGQTIAVVGCGRTDTGVHAMQYYMHFDFDGIFPKEFVRRINKFLPKDIAIYRIFPVAPEAHARFDANSRSYAYHLSFQKNPFETDTAYYYPYPAELNFERMQEAAKLLLQYHEFFPFCKTHTDAKTMKCDLSSAAWEIFPTEQRAVFHITANRFLRGMVRLIVGMCINVGNGKLELSTVKTAMDQQSRLAKSLSVPPQGLYLRDILYPFDLSGNIG